ncbi:MFS transporter [Leucobacter sp. OH2974_COT-288]|uniref:Lysosomal dipeptide transporter MFSD1 n=1 Tax=Canibacter oris TaxID=1365628 RepID=A0A840DRJ6_9MICO|nr:MFS transporter [Canibacter oris]MBB4072139.1 MFS family permease [Canibacter oris]RRD36615.1 MFS transporter [Leucobacter sp. OH2974_COT-288]
MPRGAKVTAAVWVVWSVAIVAYALAIINRTSFARLGSTAQLHFGIEATLLSVLLVMQVAVYVVMQIPVGVLLDRFGATKVIVCGLFVMACGQLLLAYAPQVSLAVLARILVGIGDAGLFIGALRLVADWFPLRVVPMVSQFTGMLGALGQVIAVIPLANLVHNTSWVLGFLVLALATFAGTVLAAFVLRDNVSSKTVVQQLFGARSAQVKKTASGAETPQLWDSPIGHISPPTTAIPIVGPGGSGIFNAFKSLLRRPGVRLGYWVHFGTAGALHCYVLLWGNAFLTGGVGLDGTAAASLLTLTVLAAIGGGLVIGPLQARYKRHRINFTVGYIVTLALVWFAVLVWPGGQPPLWLLVVMSVVLAIGGPTCMIGFDIVRTHVHRNQIGMASGIINTGSFTAALGLLFGIGMLLDLQGAGTPESYSWDAFRVAMSLQFVFWGLAVAGILYEFPKAKRALQRRLDRAKQSEYYGYDG